MVENDLLKQAKDILNVEKVSQQKINQFLKWIPLLGLLTWPAYNKFCGNYGYIQVDWIIFHLTINQILTLIIFLLVI